MRKPLLVGLSGEAGAGKDTFAKVLAKYHGDGALILSFAEPVYALAEALVAQELTPRDTKEKIQVFHVSQKLLEDMCYVYSKYGLDKYKDFPNAWAEFFEGALKEYVQYSPYEDKEFALVLSPRKLLELVGTELGREILTDTIWLDVVASRVEKFKGDLVVVTDARFDNEAAFIRSKQGLLVDIFCPNNVHATKSTHKSAKGISGNLLTHSFTNHKDGVDRLEVDIAYFYHKAIRGKV